MKTPRIKFCGLTRVEDVEAAISLGADFLGFIVECPSPRRLSVSNAALLACPAQGLAKRVAVTVNADDCLIASIMEDMRPDALQFHGGESPERLQEINDQYAVSVIKAVSIADREDLEHAKTYAKIADFLLLDAKPPKDNEQRGGHGHTFDWTLLKDFKSDTPLIIAGGLSAETVSMARKMTKAHIFDVSSGIEAAPGIKDAALMSKFMNAARQE